MNQMIKTRTARLEAQIAAAQAEFSRYSELYLNGDTAAKTMAQYHASLRDNLKAELEVERHAAAAAARLVGSDDATQRRADALRQVDEVAALMDERQRLAEGLDEAVALLADLMGTYIAACDETTALARQAARAVTPPAASTALREDLYAPAAAAATHHAHWMFAAVQALQKVFAPLRAPELLFSVAPQYQVRSGTPVVTFADAATEATRVVVEPLRTRVNDGIAAADRLVAESTAT